MGRRRRSNAILMWRGVAGEEEEDEESGGEDLRPLSDDDAHRHSLEEQEDAIVYQGDEVSGLQAVSFIYANLSTR
jgi:hypothetical protein